MMVMMMMEVGAQRQAEELRGEARWDRRHLLCFCPAGLQEIVEPGDQGCRQNPAACSAVVLSNHGNVPSPGRQVPFPPTAHDSV